MDSSTAIDTTALFERYLPIVQNEVSLARLSPFITCDADTHAIGCEALQTCIRAYDSEQHGTFARFVTMRVRSAIRDEHRRLDAQRIAARKLAR